MERASLRPVLSRPPNPIAPAEAFRYVTAELPELDEPAAGALALLTLVGQSRGQIAAAADPAAVAALSGEPLAEALARGRKALRRQLYPLPGSGWCERAERLISDRLDDTLEDPGPARLDVHLSNCTRCVEHERRLAQAQESLVAGFVEAHPAEEPEPGGLPSPDEVADEETAEVPAPPLLRVLDTPMLPPAPPPEAPADEQRQEPPPPAVPVPAAVVVPAKATPTVPIIPPPAPPSDPPPQAPSASPWAAQQPRPWTPPPQAPNAWRSDSPRPALAAHKAFEDESLWTAVGPLVAVLSVTVVIAILAMVLAAGG